MTSLLEFRLLEGPNLYFPRPAAKVTLDLGPFLELDVAELRIFATEIGLGRVRPGPAGSVFRQRFAARSVGQVVRLLARAGGVPRLAVRSRPGNRVEELVVAYPWRNAEKAELLAETLAAVLDAVGTGTDQVTVAIAAGGERLAASAGGRAPRLIRPSVPVVAVTGTNGKTTTSRMIGFIAQQAGQLVGWSSTDGVYLDGVLVEAGDYSGPSGASQVLKYPGVQLAVTETARGGILRRGIGVAYNDVSVVTNISADHLGVDGIETLDQLAEVKAVVTKITKPNGWCVLNADDPRTFAMRLGTKAKVWAFTRDPDSPSARAVLDEGGRVTTVIDGWVAVLSAGGDPLPVVEVVDIPMTLAGLSLVNVENALAAASATLALGFTVEQVTAGLTAFAPGENNPGRMNIWTVPLPDRVDHGDVDHAGVDHGRQVSVVIDLAHNEAGLEALLAIMNGIRPEGGRLLLAIGTAGDRGDDVFVRLGEVAALGADVIEIVHKNEYLRGRSMEATGNLFREGAAHAGLEIVGEHPTEVAGIASLVAKAQPGDVIAMMTHQDRVEVDAWLLEHGATLDGVDTLRAKVRAAGPSAR